MVKLPIHEFEPAISAALRHQRRLVLSAPTGSGKSTQVPQMVLDRVECPGRILVLQPRRLAARLLARRVAAERGEEVGGTVGFQTRYEAAVSGRSRIVYLTEGILVRLLADDPTLPGVGAVLFDEFHERSVAAEVGLALLRDALQRQRSDVLLGVMSATLDTEALADYLAPCPVVRAEGRSYPIDIGYLQPGSRKPVWDQAASELQRLLATGVTGDVLIFMPGQYEIGRTISSCRQAKLGESVRVLPLYGDLSAARQDEVMAAGGDRRKVIVATNIAETSLTIPGVRHVIDSGLARVHRYDPVRGLNTLYVEPISQAAAAQRAGRAGRQGPGACVRLWSEREQANRPATEIPEIQRVDLAEPLLMLRCLGLAGMDALEWLDPPPPARIAAAEEVLATVGALSRDGGALTPVGKQLARLPVHPRLARLLLEAHERRALAPACEVAALLEERPIVGGGKTATQRFREGFSNTLDRTENNAPTAVQSDLFAMLQALAFARRSRFAVSACDRMGLNANACRQVDRAARHLLTVCRRQGWRPLDQPLDTPSRLLQAVLLAFPDHLARKRDVNSRVCELRGGRRGELAPTSATRRVSLLVASEIREVSRAGDSAKVLLSMISEVRGEWLDQLFPDDWEFLEETTWNAAAQVVEERRITRCLGVTLNEVRSSDVAPGLAAARLAEAIGVHSLPLQGWGKTVRNWIERVRCVGEWFPGHPLLRYDDDELRVALEEFCAGHRRYADVRRKPALPYIQNLLSWEDRRFVEKMAPAELPLPSGRRLRIKYRSGQPPRASARIQDLYGLEVTPRVADGGQAVLLEILAPNMRAVQITDDLARFWRELYPTVKQQLAKRYPKHEWR